MITPQQCLAGLFFLAAALALVGFFGALLRHGSRRASDSAGENCQGAASARNSAAKFSRRALSFISFQLPSKTGFVASKIVAKTARSRLFDTARARKQSSSCATTHTQENAALFASLRQITACLHSCNFTQPRGDLTQLQRR